MTFTIRRAVTTDAAALSELATRIFVDTFAADNRPEDMADFISRTYNEPQQRREIEDPEGVTLLAESDGALIAYAQVRCAKVPEGIDSEASVQISRFYVDKPWHGRGVAQQLMDASLATARELGASTVWLGVWERNDRAIAFYRKLGFIDTGRMDFHVGSDRQTDVVMVRGLNAR